jgi:polar amino acid transport system substrate-binding protein
MKGTLSGVFCAATICLVALSLNGAEPSDEKLPAPFPTAPIPNQKLVVGISTGPPFNIRNADGTWTGISVELWQQIAKELKLDFEFRETDLNGNFVGLAQGWLDLAIGPLTITERREEVCDFTDAYFSSSLAIAVPASRLPQSARFLIPLLDLSLWWTILRIGTGLLSVMAIVAFLIWLCERRVNSAHFGGGGRPARGYGAALWWAAVTMTTVGYGDISPRTLKGRVIAVLWMFVSLVLVSIFTALCFRTQGRESLARSDQPHLIAQNA